MRRIISTSAVLLALASLTFVGMRHGDSTVSAQPADNQIAPQPATTDVDEQPLAQGPADQAPEVDEAQLQAEQRAKEALLRPADQASEVDETTNAGQLSQIEQQETLRQVTPRVPIFDVGTARLSFQAVLTDNMGNALPGPTVDLQFQIYTSPGGVAVGAAITVCAVPIVNGVVDTQVPVPASSIDGTGRQMGVSVDTTGACAAFGPELAPRTELTAVPHAFRVDRVASAELDDVISLGDATTLGQLSVHDGIGTVGIFLDGSSGGGGRILLRNSAGSNRVDMDGESAGAGLLVLRQNDGSTGVIIDGDNGTNVGGRISVHDSVSGTRVQLLGESIGTGGEISVFDDNGTETIELLGAKSTLEGGQITIRNDSGINTIELDGDSSNAGIITVRDSAGSINIRLEGQNAGAGLIQVNQNDTSIGVTIDGDRGTNIGGRISVRDSTSNTRVEITGESNFGTGGEISVFDDNGTETVEILGAETSSQGGQILLRRADGTTTIEIDGDFGGDGRIITQELQITGGSDLSEQFDVLAAADGKVEPGMVVCIDPKRPGKLLVGAHAYDRTVAGIISGAGGLETGMYMGQRGSEEADGQYPVALTGRVYVWCDASGGAVEPGDMLTTSKTPGHAMKVTDHAKAQGAIIGKAMGSLKSGRGLVLVLVSLQ